MYAEPLVVSVDWLHSHLDDPDLILLDVSMEQVVGRIPVRYDQPCYLPGALKFDLEQVFVDPDSTLPHTLPSPERFTELARALGISASSRIVVYDNQGIYSSPRAWWMFQVMGHAQVQVLDGGLPAWLAKGHATQTEPGLPRITGDFQAHLQSRWLSDSAKVLQALDDPDACVIDARAAARFAGRAAEPRPGLRSGHMPGALNLPFLQLMGGDGYDSLDALAARFARLGVTPDQSLIFSCGSGITACIVLFAAAQLGYHKLSVYDGSWAEWGADDSLPVVTGASVLFLSHGGGPLPLLGDPGHQAMCDNLRGLVGKIPTPEAILVVSAHWEAAQPTLTHAANPEMLYDYYGFPEEAYQLQYPAPGFPVFAEKLASTLRSKGIEAQLDATRGYDHGVYVPLMLLYPEASIPCVQLSLMKHLDAEQHLQLGEALADSLDGRVLVVGSGFSFHNMRAFFAASTPETEKMNQDFEDWLQETVSSGALSEAERRMRLVNWQQAPHARYCHPREEHLLPLQVCYGIAGGPCREAYRVEILGKQASVFLW